MISFGIALILVRLGWTNLSVFNVLLVTAVLEIVACSILLGKALS